MSSQEDLREEAYREQAIEDVLSESYIRRYYEDHFDLDQQSILLSHICEPYDMKEYSVDKIDSNDGQITKTSVVTKSMMVSEDKRLAIWSKDLDVKYWPQAFVEAIPKSVDIQNSYEGDNYYLVSCDNIAYAVNISEWSLANNIIKELDYHFKTRIEKILISKSHKHLYLETSWAYVAIACLNIKSPEEEERVILSKKLDASQPFFEFKAPIKVEWEKLKEVKAKNFEKICELLLQREPNIAKVVPMGKTNAADRGRDFEVHEKELGYGNTSTKIWMVQCKFSESSVSPSSVHGWTDRVLEHGYDGFWLITNNDLTPTLIDQLNGVSKNDNININIRFWQRSDLHVKLNVYAEILRSGEFFD